MSDIRNKMQKKKEKSETKTGSVISGMLGSSQPKEIKEPVNTPPDMPAPAGETEPVPQADDAGAKNPEADKQTKSETKNTGPQKIGESEALTDRTDLQESEPSPFASVLEYKSVPNETKTRRKQILFYPSLCAELEQIAKETGSSVNDLVNQVMLAYVNQNPSAKTRKKMK